MLVLLISGTVVTGFIRIGFLCVVGVVFVFDCRLSVAFVTGLIYGEIEYAPVDRIKKPPKWIQ